MKHIDSCKKATELMSKSFERKLSAIETTQLKAHLNICKTCKLCLKQLKKLKQIFKKYSDAIASPDISNNIQLSPKAKNKIITMLTEEQANL